MNGAFGWLVRFFHSIFTLFKNNMHTDEKQQAMNPAAFCVAYHRQRSQKGTRRRDSDHCLIKITRSSLPVIGFLRLLLLQIIGFMLY